MENYFEKFIRDEYEWMYECEDCTESLLQYIDGEMELEEFDENYDDFLNQAIKDFCNDEYIIQIIHDQMHNTLLDVVQAYIDNKRD